MEDAKENKKKPNFEEKSEKNIQSVGLVPSYAWAC